MPHDHALARKLSSSGCIFRNADGRSLLVKPTYKSGWEIPGGIAEVHETPRQTAEREVFEELGLRIRVGRPLCVDHRLRTDGQFDSLQFLFYGGVLLERDVAAIRLPEWELSEFRFVEAVDISNFVVEAVALRVACGLRALASGRLLYLEDGLAVD